MCVVLRLCVAYITVVLVCVKTISIPSASILYQPYIFTCMYYIILAPVQDLLNCQTVSFTNSDFPQWHSTKAAVFTTKECNYTRMTKEARKYK